MVHFAVSMLSSLVNLRVNGLKQLVLDSLSFLCSNSAFVVLPVEDFRFVRKYILNSNNKIKITCLVVPRLVKSHVMNFFPTVSER